MFVIIPCLKKERSAGRFLDVASMIYLDRGRWVPEPSELEEYLATDENTEKAHGSWRSWSRYAMEIHGKYGKIHPFYSQVKVGHLFLWAIYTMANC